MFRAVSVLFGIAIALLLSELMLIVYGTRVEVREQMDEGLIVYHPGLGWKLMPGWRGTHQHNDYVAEYSIDFRGMRNSIPPSIASLPRILVVGDSFTFGLGVGDDETFVSRLNKAGAGFEFVNAAIPGFAPDQVMLYLDQAVALARPDRVMFVVYLGNDLIDIGLPYPVQASHGKPFVAFGPEGELLVRNTPVPRTAKPAELAGRSLGSYISEERSFIGNSRVAGLLQEAGLLSPLNKDQFDEQLAPRLALFDAVVKQMLLDLDVPMSLVLMPGASVANTPGSLSSRYQQAVQAGLVRIARDRGLEVILLDDAVRAMPDNLYYPNDGHLTAQGHALVARQILAAMSNY